jgi:vacuolar protein sorting-associated protein 13A/C
MVVILLDVDTRIATLTLSTANVSLTLENSAMRVGVQLGNLSLTDDSSQPTRLDAYKELVTIEGSDLLDLTYETFNVHTRSAAGGVDSATTLRSGSIKIHFVERPFHDLYSFMIKFARLKTLYDSATQAAVQRASEIQKMKFDISIQSPIIVFPDHSSQSDQRLIMRLGEVYARNKYLDMAAETIASLRGISLTSESPVDGELVVLSIVDAVDINTNIIQRFEGRGSETSPAPENEV